jgi:hypothetical protein
MALWGRERVTSMSRTLTANSCNANGSVRGLRTCTTAGTGGDAVKSFLPVVMSTRATCAQAVATHGVVDITALDVMPTKASGVRDMWVGASSTKTDMATVDEVAIGEAEIRVDRDSVQVSPCVPALETEHACAIRWRVASVE